MDVHVRWATVLGFDSAGEWDIGTGQSPNAICGRQNPYPVSNRRQRADIEEK